MFNIIDKNFNQDSYGQEEYLSNWPMIYVLEDGTRAYIGQTNSINNRMSQHRANEEKKDFKNAHFIYSNEFNQSVTFDYESRLIELMFADGKFKLLNRNNGLSGLNYYNKDYYEQNFASLWFALQQKGLVEKSIDELEQTDLFKYSPYKKLSNDQRNAVSLVYKTLQLDEKQTIVINGMPGSGKTVVAIYLFKLLKETPEYKDLNIGFVVPQIALRKTIRDVFKNIPSLDVKDVLGPTDVAKKQYDILIVDEAHRLKFRKNLSNYSFYDESCEKIGLSKDSSQIDWILKQSKCAILLYDRNQAVGPGNITADMFTRSTMNSFSNRICTYFNLITQMRCKGGNDYISFLDKLFFQNQKVTFSSPNYEFAVIDDFHEFENLYRQKLSEFPLTRMLAGYAWDWKSKKDKTQMDIMIEGVSKQWNGTLENWINSPNAINEVGCIHTVQGYDLSYGFVIMGNEIGYDPIRGCITIDKDNYYDKYGKYGATDEELKVLIENIYYVLLTRGIQGSYVYACNKELRKYLKETIGN